MDSTYINSFPKNAAFCFCINLMINFTEPVGSVAPKVDTRDEFTFTRAQLHADKALICPAQSYPMPVFR